MGQQELYLTLVLFNLASNITKDLVVDFFNRNIADSQPIVSRLVQKRDKSKTTTVTVGGNSDKVLREKIKSFKKPGFDKSPLNSEAGFSYSFLGLTPLYSPLHESSSEPPAFDVYFVHGLGGHAFNTWASKPEHHAHVCMWPRDILPAYLEREREGQEQLYGRYSTFGYDASVKSGSEMEQSIPETAGVLLNAVAASRAGNVPMNSPIFFVCHSLGGLVTCQAIVTILSKKENRQNFEESLLDRFFHSRHGKCLIRGITFFGTPFEGSKLADLAPVFAPVLGLRSGKGSFISALKVKDRQVQNIVQNFDTVRREPQNRIRLVIFFEKKEMGRGMIKTMVTEKQSALSTFHDKVDQEPLLLDHRNIVKFIHEADRDFQQAVGPLILNMIRSGLAEMSDFNMQYREPQELGAALARKANIDEQIAQFIPEADDEEAEDLDPRQQVLSGTSMSFKAAEKSTRWMLLRFARSTDVEKVLRVLFEGIPETDNTLFIRKQMTQVKDPIGNTCDWVLDESLFKEWEEGTTTDNVLFFLGIEGSGKSVLAKYIINRIREKQPRSAVASFFCRSIGTTTTPANVLRHVILQLDKQSPDLILKSLFDRPITFFKGHFDVNVLWILFKAMCKNIERKVFVVVDGLDECLKTIQLRPGDTPSGIDPIKQFLEQVCDLMTVSSLEAEGQKSNKSSRESRTAICVLTRPQDQVDAATNGRNCVISIEPDDVQKRASQLIESEVARLVAEEKLSSDLEQVVRENLLAKTEQTLEAAFQWANTAIERMQNKVGSTTEKLDAIHPGLYSVYADVLQQISAQEQVKEVASFLFRTLVFAQDDFTFAKLDNALAMNYTPGTNERIPESKQMSIRQVVDLSRGLVTVQGNNVRLSHESVRDFFIQLSSTDSPRFSCTDPEKGHTNMALLCLRCLTNWHRIHTSKGYVDVEDSEDAKDQVLYLVKAYNQPFIDYALDFWAFHVRESGQPSEKLLSMLRNFLQEEKYSYRLALALDDFRDGFDFDLSKAPESPTLTFVRHNLFHMLKQVKVKRYDASPRRSHSILARFSSTTKQKSANTHPGPFSFQLEVNERDKSGSSLLHIAAKHGYFNVVTYLLDHGANGDAFDSNGATAFWLAVKNNRAPTAELLMQRECAFDRRYNEDQANSLYLASYYGMAVVVKHLLKTTDPNTTNYPRKWTALQAAAELGHESVLKILLDHGANVNMATNAWKLSPLHLAASIGHNGICNRLFKADPTLEINLMDEDGETAIYKAAREGHAATVELLLSKGATMVTETVDGFSPVHIAALRGHASVLDIIANEHSVNDISLTGRQPIHLAAQSRQTHAIESLVKLGADPNAKGMDIVRPESRDYYVTPIVIAAEIGDEDAVKLLMSMDVEVENWRSGNDETLLTCAARGGNLAVVKMILQKGLDPFSQSKAGTSPFYVASLNGHLPVVRELWAAPSKKGRNIDLTDENNYTPLIAAAWFSYKDVVDFCLEQGANPNTADSLGRTPVFSVVRSYKDAYEDAVKILKTLIDSGASVEKATNEGHTPLHAATDPGKEELLTILLGSGAKVDAIAKDGSSPLHAAATNRSELAFLQLLGRGGNPLLIDSFGYTCLDIAAGYKPIYDLPELAEFKKGYAPLGLLERQQRIRVSVAQHLTGDMDFRTGIDRTNEEMSWAVALGDFFFLMDREEDARIGYEHLVIRTAMQAPSLMTTCAKCQKSYQRGPFWICRDCRPVMFLLCNSCYKKYEDGDVCRGCSKEHSHMEIGGQYWKELKPGTVRKDGLTMLQWRDNLRQEFGVEKPASEK